METDKSVNAIEEKIQILVYIAVANKSLTKLLFIVL